MKRPISNYKAYKIMDIRNGMKSLDLKDNGLFVVILLFIAIFIAKALLSLPFYSPFIMMDEVYYDSVAQNVLDGKLYAKFLPYFGTTPPGYSIFLSLAYLFSQDKDIAYHIMLAINALVGSSIIFPTYFILRKFCEPFISILGSLLVAVLPVVSLFSFILMSENLFIPLFVFSIWLIIESYERGGPVWEILASFSVVFIYITRSTGIAMLAGFVAAFMYYAFISRKSKGFFALVKEKKVLLLSFIVFLALWLIYTSYCVPYGRYSIGSPYKAESAYTGRIASAFTHFDVMKGYVISLVREFDYLALATYFIIVFFLFYYLRSLIRRKGLDNPLYISIIYFVISALGLLAISTTFMSYSYTRMMYEVYGRYIEAIVPPVFIFSIIGATCFVKENHADIKKWVAPLLVYVLLILFVLFTIPSKNYNIVNTLSIYYLYVIYNPVFSYVLLFLFALALFSMLYLAFIDGRSIYVILSFLVCFSLVFSAPTYWAELLCSSNAGDDIVYYLKDNCSRDSVVFIDRSAFSGIGWYTGSETLFWCNGSVLLTVDAMNASSNSTYKNNPIYIISNKDYPCKVLANGSMGLRLYSYNAS